MRNQKALLAVMAVLSSASTPLAQPEGSASALFTDSLDIQLINVEVWVTDGQGNPVTGLGVEDFVIREDGKKVTISNFAEVRSLESPTIDTTAAELGSTPENDLEIDPLELRQEGFLILYVDELFSGPAGRVQLIDDLRGFFGRQRVPPDRVLILRQDKDLQVEANLGSTEAELEAALERLEQPSVRGAQTWVDERQAFRRLLDHWEREAVHRRIEPPAVPCDFVIQDLLLEVQFHADLSRARIEETLGHLADAASFLGGLPGPKTLVYVSDGLPTTPGASHMSFVKHLCPDRPTDRRLDLYHGLNESFRRLSRHANANRVTIYTLQATGLREQNTDSSAALRGLRRTPELLDRFAGESRAEHRQGLFLLANETGGRAVVNRNTLLQDLEDIAEDMSGYYSLAYEPPHGGDGLEHRIDVRVRAGGRKGDQLRVRHRPGYRDKSPDQRMFERLESTLHLDLMDNPLEVRLGAGQVVRAEKNKSTVPLHVQVPVDRITFLNYLGMERASFKVLALARDESSGKTSFKHESYRLTRPLPPEPDQRISLVFELELEQGIHVVALGIRDETTKETSFVSTSLEILAPGTTANSG